VEAIDRRVPPVTLIIGLIITGLVLTLGGGPDGQRRGFQYWRNPGAVARAGLIEDLGTDRFLAILSVVVQAAFSFQAMELVAMYVLSGVSRGKIHY
jgi:amino acid transporter